MRGGTGEAARPRRAGRLCGFADFSSIAIRIAVTGSLAPNRRPMLAQLGLRVLAAGSMANLTSAALASLMIPG